MNVEKVNRLPKILAVLGGLGTLIHAERIAELACHLYAGHTAKLILVYPIIVPLALPLEAAMSEEEQLAQNALAPGMAVVKQYGLNAEARIIRHRHPVDVVLDLASVEHIDQIVLDVHLNPKLIHDYDQADTVEDEIIRRAVCEVIVDREPITNQE